MWLASGRRFPTSHMGDLDGDGAVTSYDAYLLLRALNSGVMTLPAGGQAEIQVELALTQAQKTRLNEAYSAGAYVEGYLYAQQLPTAEGVEGTVHSIPVLGFYGNWTDASMFDVGSYTILPVWGRGADSVPGGGYGDKAFSPYAGHSLCRPAWEELLLRRQSHCGRRDVYARAQCYQWRAWRSDQHLELCSDSQCGCFSIYSYPGREDDPRDEYRKNGCCVLPYQSGRVAEHRVFHQAELYPFRSGRRDANRTGLTMAPELYVDATGQVN